MKKKLIIRLFVLSAMALFTVAGCQNEDIEIAKQTDDEITYEMITTTISQLRSGFLNAADEQIKAADEELNAAKTLLAASPSDVELQKNVIALAAKAEGYSIHKANGLAELDAIASKAEDANSSGVQPMGIFDDIKEEIEDFVNDLIKPWVNELYEKTIKPWVNSAINQFFESLAAPALQALDDRTLQYGQRISTLEGLLNLSNGTSVRLDGIESQLADHFQQIEENREDIDKLIEKYKELKRLIIKLHKRLTIAEAEIDDLQERVAYIEDVEIPAIWEGISFLYDYIGDVYENLDQRVTGITFKPEYDYGPGLSSLILVRGISEWKPKSVENGLGWQVKETGSVYKGFTWLTYNISPANADIDLATVELVYTTTKLITRSAGEEDPLLKIADEDSRYQMSFEDGVLRVPVLIHKDAYPLIQTSFEPEASENIKVALKLKNSGYTAGEEPTRPEKPDSEDPVRSSIPGDGNGDGDEADRSIVSSEYVTVWLGLFEGYIAENAMEYPDPDTGEPTLYPTEIIKADFIDKTNEEFPSVNLLVTSDDATNEIDIANSVVAIYFDQFEKEYKELLNDNFEKDYTLTYEFADLGNNHGDFVSLDGSKVKVTRKQKSIGETVAVVVKAKVGEVVHAVGYVRVLIIGEDKEVIVIEDELLLAEVTINCSESVEFTKKNAVKTFVNNKILDSEAVNVKTKIKNAAVFYQKYTGIVIDGVTVENNDAQLATLTEDDLKSLFNFTYVPGDAYIKGTISNNAPIGTYEVVTTLSSEERIPDIQITWVFTVKTPKLIWNKTGTALVVDPTVPDMTNIYSPQATEAAFGTSISDQFKKHTDGGFEYADLKGQVCPEFVVPYFVFTNVPNGYTIEDDGESVMKNGVTVASIVEVEGDFRIILYENDEVAGLIGNNEIKIAGKGIINGGTHTIYDSFNVIFTNPLIMVFPSNAKFNSSNMYLLNFYNNNNSTPNVVRDYKGTQLTVYNVLPSKIFIDHYGVDLNFDTSFSINTSLPTQETIYSPYKFYVENATFNKPVTGVEVVIEKFQTADARSYYSKRTPIRYRFKLVNNSGSPLPSGLEVTIPAELKHRWGITTENLVIKVN